jgi:integrase
MKDTNTETEKERRKRGEGCIFKRGSTYYIGYSAGGKYIKESAHTDNEVEAQKLLFKRQAEVEGGLAGSPLRVTVSHLLDDLIAEHERLGLSSLRTTKTHAARIRRDIGNLKAAPPPKTPVLIRLARKWQEEKLMPATINKHMGTLARAFNFGKETGRIATVPNFPEALPEDNARQTYVAPADVDNIVVQVCAGASKHHADPDLADFVDWLHGSSQRWGETASLTWNMFNHTTWELRIPGKKTKNRQPRCIPLDEKVEHLREIMVRRLAARRLDCPYIFHRDGQRIREFRKAWQSACKRAGFGGTRETGITPHDLRHIAATNMRRAGIPESLIMVIGGWETASMFRRYCINESQEIAANLGKYSDYLKTAKTQAPKVVPITKVS